MRHPLGLFSGAVLAVLVVGPVLSAEAPAPAPAEKLTLAERCERMLAEQREFDKTRRAFTVADVEAKMSREMAPAPLAVPGTPGAVEGGTGAVVQPPVTPPGVPPATGGGAPPVMPPPAETEKVLQISFWAGRNALFTAWNAAANFADMAGRANVTLRGESDAAFDKDKLQNGVMEPLREADLIE